MYQANSIDEYLKIIGRFNDYSEIYYRGQLEKYTSILPSIARENGYLSNEASIYSDAVRMREDDFKELKTPLEKLAKMQHYNIPTRLVDVTVNPLVALYFAVENVEDASSGNVYLYAVEGVTPDSVVARILSALPTLESVNVDNIQESIKEQYGESVSKDTILSIVDTPIFIKYSDKMQNSNPRLYQQKGTFLICGNEVIDGEITRTLHSLDYITPSAIIRIPYEYKQSIKDELDLKYKISSPSLFPELPSVADYIREKYKERVFSLDDKYHIVKTDDVSIGVAKRLSVMVVLDEKLMIDEIQQIAIDIMEKYKRDNRVIWIYVANTEDDYILYNWILRGQWIDNTLDKRFQPLPLHKEERGYYWDFEKTYSVMSDYYEKNIFEDDKLLYERHKEIWGGFLPIFNTLRSTFQADTMTSFIVETKNQKMKISDLYMKLQGLGHSRNKEFDDFLSQISICLGQADDFRFWTTKDNLSEKAMEYHIGKLIENISKAIIEINEGLEKWGVEINIED